MVPAILWFAAIAAGSSADPDVTTAKGAALYRGCQAELRLMEPGALSQASQGDLVNGTYCVGYLTGFLANLPTSSSSICPGDRPMGMVVRAYVEYLDKNQQLLEQDKRLGLLLALEAAFPCPTPAGLPALSRTPGARLL